MLGLSGFLVVPLLVLIFAFRSFGYEPYRFPSASMMPTVPPGAYMIAQKFGYGHYGSFGITVLRTSIAAEIRRGDIIVFAYPRDLSVKYAKRVIGLPGDVVEYSGRRLTINGEPARMDARARLISDNSNVKYEVLRESLSGRQYDIAYTEVASSNNFSATVPSASYFVLGDNRDHSNDSRYWGFVPAGNVVGKIVYVFR